MKRLFTFLFVVSIISASLLAEDVSVEERFALVSSGNNSTAANYNGDLCTWNILANRRASDTIVIDGKKQQCWWLNRADVNQDGSYMQTINWEGGVKNVAFRCAQFGGESKNTLKLSFEVGEESHVYTIKNNPTKDNGGETSNFDFNQKSGQLIIRNVSSGTGANQRRILVHYITITPYLLYPRHNKYITLGLKQKGFANYLINNTGGDDITYESSTTSVATVDNNGVITPAGVGSTTITASWEGCSTSYSLTIIDEAIVENFSQVGRVNGSITEAADLWSGDISNWNVRYVRRGVADSVAGSFISRKQATWLTRPATTKTGYIEMPAIVEGGVKHVKIPWQQWATESGNLKLVLYTATAGGSWAEKASQNESVIGKGANFSFDKDIDTDGSLGNVRIKISNESFNGESPTTARLIIENVQITPWLLYTTKAATLDTRNGLTYINNDLIDNTGSDDVEFTIAPTDGGATIIASGENAGQVTAENDETEGDFTVTATWSGVSTSYALHIISRTATTASYPNAKVYLNLGDELTPNVLSITTDGYEEELASESKEIVYSSSNEAVATITDAGVVSLTGGVGQATITANLPQTTNFKSTTAKYDIYVIDNRARIEAFSGLGTVGVPSDNKWYDWTGDLFAWQRQYQVRHNSDNVKGVSGESHIGVSVGIQDPTGTPISSTLRTKDVVEGGIKHLSFYWGQIGAHYEATRRIAVYAGETLIGYGEHSKGKQYDEFLLGINNAMRSNKQLVIKNESYLGETYATKTSLSTSSNSSRIVLDNIYITPWLLYTEKAPAEITVGNTTYKNESLINNTAGETGELSFISSNTSVAEIGADGTINAKAPGTVTITAKFKWSESEFVTTTYSLAVVPATNCETFANISNSCIVCPGSKTCATSPVTDELDNGISWTYWLGGGNTSVFGRKAMYLRARLSTESSYDYGYLRSSQIPGGLSSLTFAWNQGGTESGQTYNIEVKVNGDVVGSITAEGQAAVYETPQIFTVSGLDYKGNAVIEIVNKTEYDGTSSRGRLVIDYLYWTSNAGAIELDEESDNSSILTWNDNAVADVNTNRSLVAGYWNTLCLPFAVSKSADLGGADVQELYSATRDGDDLVVGFKVLNSDELVAGTPYLVKPTSNIDLTSFTGKRIVATPTLVNKGIVTLTGIFSPQALVANDKTTLFVGTPDGAGNNLFYPSTNGNLKGMRAYFKVDSGSGAPVRRARFVVDAETVATEIGNTKIQAPTEKQLIDGQLFIIRDGVRYNTIGQIIK